ncbi:unnamed protein product [Amoebophrya sp. A120]|nr:unnamed protein product [Amoebophrya sp. A120]|eukprot:GSA120T00012948001.1
MKNAGAGAAAPSDSTAARQAQKQPYSSAAARKADAEKILSKQDMVTMQFGSVTVAMSAADARHYENWNKEKRQNEDPVEQDHAKQDHAKIKRKVAETLNRTPEPADEKPNPFELDPDIPPSDPDYPGSFPLDDAEAEKHCPAGPDPVTEQLEALRLSRDDKARNELRRVEAALRRLEGNRKDLQFTTAGSNEQYSFVYEWLVRAITMELMPHDNDKKLQAQWASILRHHAVQGQVASGILALLRWWVDPRVLQTLIRVVFSGCCPGVVVKLDQTTTPWMTDDELPKLKTESKILPTTSTTSTTSPKPSASSRGQPAENAASSRSSIDSSSSSGAPPTQTLDLNRHRAPKVATFKRSKKKIVIPDYIAEAGGLWPRMSDYDPNSLQDKTSIQHRVHETVSTDFATVPVEVSRSWGGLLMQKDTWRIPSSVDQGSRKNAAAGGSNDQTYTDQLAKAARTRRRYAAMGAAAYTVGHDPTAQKPKNYVDPFAAAGTSQFEDEIDDPNAIKREIIQSAELHPSLSRDHQSNKPQGTQEAAARVQSSTVKLDLLRLDPNLIVDILVYVVERAVKFPVYGTWTKFFIRILREERKFLKEQRKKQGKNATGGTSGPAAQDRLSQENLSQDPVKRQKAILDGASSPAMQRLLEKAPKGLNLDFLASFDSALSYSRIVAESTRPEQVVHEFFKLRQHYSEEIGQEQQEIQHDFAHADQQTASGSASTSPADPHQKQAPGPVLAKLLHQGRGDPKHDDAPPALSFGPTKNRLQRVLQGYFDQGNLELLRQVLYQEGISLSQKSHFQHVWTPVPFQFAFPDIAVEVQQQITDYISEFQMALRLVAKAYKAKMVKMMSRRGTIGRAPFGTENNREKGNFNSKISVDTTIEIDRPEDLSSLTQISSRLVEYLDILFEFRSSKTDLPRSRATLFVDLSDWRKEAQRHSDSIATLLPQMANDIRIVARLLGDNRCSRILNDSRDEPVTTSSATTNHVPCAPQHLVDALSMRLLSRPLRLTASDLWHVWQEAIEVVFAYEQQMLRPLQRIVHLSPWALHTLEWTFFTAVAGSTFMFAIGEPVTLTTSVCNQPSSKKPVKCIAAGKQGTVQEVTRGPGSIFNKGRDSASEQNVLEQKATAAAAIRTDTRRPCVDDSHSGLEVTVQFGNHAFVVSPREIVSTVVPMQTEDSAGDGTNKSLKQMRKVLKTIVRQHGLDRISDDSSLSLSDLRQLFSPKLIDETRVRLRELVTERTPDVLALTDKREIMDLVMHQGGLRETLRLIGIETDTIDEDKNIARHRFIEERWD